MPLSVLTLRNFRVPLGIIGIIIVLVVGGIWRKRALESTAHPAPAA